MAERARQLAQHRVAHDHRRQLAAGEHVAADRDDVAGEVLEDALVEALVAAAQQRQRGLAGELARRAPRRAAARRARARSRAGCSRSSHRIDAVVGAQRAVEHVHAQHHPGAAAERRVVDLPAAERRVIAEVRRTRRREPAASALATWRWEANHSNHSGNSVKTSMFTLSPRRRPPTSAVEPRKSRSTSIRRCATSTLRIASLTIGTSSGSPPRARLDLERLARGQLEQAATVPSSRSPSSTSQPSSSCAHHSPSPSAGACSRGDRQLRAPQRLGARRGPRRPPGARSGAASVPARRTIAAARARRRVTLAPSVSRRGAGRVT